MWILIAHEHSKVCLAGNPGTSFRLVVEVATIAEINHMQGNSGLGFALRRLSHIPPCTVGAGYVYRAAC